MRRLYRVMQTADRKLLARRQEFEDEVAAALADGVTQQVVAEWLGVRKQVIQQRMRRRRKAG